MKNAVSRVTVLLAGFCVAAACGGGTDASPFSPPPPGPDSGAAGGGDSGSPPPPPSQDSGQPSSDDGGGTTSDAAPSGGGLGCGMKPARYIVLGHSVAHCFAVGGPMSETCAMKNVETHMATMFPGIAYENYAVDGALIADVIQTQLPQVMGGPGNVFVNLFIGGNDLAAHLYETDMQAQQSWQSIKPQATQDLNTILSFFEDTTKFPGKAIVLVNSQYNPFDECVAGAYSFVTMVKQDILKEFNTLLGTIVAGHKDAATVDQYTNFLGHGHNYDQSQCPKYIAGADLWMADLIHPNAAGHVSLSKEMTAAVDSIYKCP
jgi:hypothetical protein